MASNSASSKARDTPERQKEVTDDRHPKSNAGLFKSEPRIDEQHRRDQIVDEERDDEPACGRALGVPRGAPARYTHREQRGASDAP